MICPLLEEIRQVTEIQHIVGFIAKSCQDGEGRKISLWVRDSLMGKWLQGQEMSKKPGFEECGKMISEYALTVLHQWGGIIR